MVITVLMLGNLWRVWRKREDERGQLVAMTSRELQDIGLTDADRRACLDRPTWHEAVSRCRRRLSDMHARRARTQRAIYRLNRMDAQRGT